jgi:Zn-dependent protease/CBS domain-containing protein
MRQSFRLGRLFGIELRVDSSWLLIFVLVSWSLSSLFASWHPEWSRMTSMAVAIAASLTFFGSVVFHELAHSLVARLYGLSVRNITLHLFGGVSNIEREPPTPGAEFVIAVVGPIASVVLGVGMLALGAFVTGFSSSEVAAEDAAAAIAAMGPVTTALMWLGPINILVGIFNLVPGFPLDGGRILRSILWKATGDLRRATLWASNIGQLVGLTFIITGIFMVFGFRVPFFGSGFGGLWLALIGLFLRNAAAQHQAGAAVQDALAGITVRDLMRTQGTWLPADLRVRSMVEGWLLRSDEAAFPVFDAGAFVGLVSVDDLRRVPASDWDARSVAEVMTPRDRLTVIGPEEEAFESLRKLGTAGTKQLPVVENDLLVGMLFERDIARWLELQSTPPGAAGRQRPRHA